MFFLTLSQRGDNVSRKKRFVLTVVVALACFALWLIVSEVTKESPRYSVQFISTPFDDPFQVHPVAINDHGHVLLRIQIHYGVPDNRKSKSFLWKRGDLVPICPECDDVHSVAFNNRDEVVGQFKQSESEQVRPFFWNPRGKMVDLMNENLRSELGDFDTALPIEINNRGEILLQGSDSSDPYNGIGPVDPLPPSFVVSASIEFNKVEVLPSGIRFIDFNDNGELLGYDDEDPNTCVLVTGEREILQVAEELGKGPMNKPVGLTNQGDVIGEGPFLTRRGEKRMLLKWSQENGIHPLPNSPDPESFSWRPRMNDRGTLVGQSGHGKMRYNLYHWFANKGVTFDWLPKKVDDWFSRPGDFFVEPWIWRDGALEEINPLLQEKVFWARAGITDINSLGQMVGQALKDGRLVPVVVTPIDSSKEN